MNEHIRSPLIRTLYAKLEHQQTHDGNSHPEWYTVRTEVLSPKTCDTFLQSFQDDETTAFLNNCFTKSDWVFTHFYHAIVKSFLTWFISATSANGLLRRGSMFVLSSAQFAMLLDIPENYKFNTLLDLGAGDGMVTAKMAPFFDKVYVTELSIPMRWRLAEHNFSILDAEEWWSSPDTGDPVFYDVVSCLNLLDRCDRPLSLLQRISSVLRPDTGLFVLALVLPLKQYVETSSDHKPAELLDVPQSTVWEVQLNALVSNVLEPQGFQLIRWTRVPYLCEGDFVQSFYYLNDVVLLLRKRDHVAEK